MGNYKKDDVFYLDEEYSQRAEFCNNSGKYHIEEIEADEKGRRFKIVENEDKSLQNEYYELLEWFDEYYSVHEQKYRRLMLLNKKDDDGSNASDELITLYELAEQKRARIQELESLINK